MLRHHNVFLSSDYKAAWERAREPGDYVRQPNFYLHNPCITDRWAIASSLHNPCITDRYRHVYHRILSLQNPCITDRWKVTSHGDIE